MGKSFTTGWNFSPWTPPVATNLLTFPGGQLHLHGTLSQAGPAIPPPMEEEKEIKIHRARPCAGHFISLLLTVFTPDLTVKKTEAQKSQLEEGGIKQPNLLSLSALLPFPPPLAQWQWRFTRVSPILAVVSPFSVNMVNMVIREGCSWAAQVLS